MKEKRVIIKTNVGFGPARLTIQEEQLIGNLDRMFNFCVTEADGRTHKRGNIREQIMFPRDVAEPANLHLTDAVSWFKKIEEVRSK
ncbi:hypothetical protein AYP76_10710 [Ligilactobacillus agilis]|uniref:hypothetical protein n=1 Tax=Ligilactobacillus agilis TaxID=1601 RepID=UPI000B5DAA7D|nr:hypothetical protein [Ligilactobacillus agilis]OXC07458.1 hypothetical protein AYP75_09910 [Ligilactobacillus agilis]OXC11074.1 hypothetical protein AYP76_10710 [Ligilactobacillus agilis]OXC11815.1 hypothetical protein AYP74_10305 [Ligilactobacillus agilis]OXS37501.1 hypothetical protein AYP70_09685 [Ligilactobacillus agilis]OXS42857.1 hypothetical protein AYP71_10165 [Ligilactobacillus agilis]